jgi:hypothetical protein
VYPWQTKKRTTRPIRSTGYECVVNGLQQETGCAGASHRPYFIFSVFTFTQTVKIAYSAPTTSSGPVVRYYFDVGLTNLTVCELEFLGLITLKAYCFHI